MLRFNLLFMSALLLLDQDGKEQETPDGKKSESVARTSLTLTRLVWEVKKTKMNDRREEEVHCIRARKKKHEFETCNVSLPPPLQLLPNTFTSQGKKVLPWPQSKLDSHSLSFVLNEQIIIQNREKKKERENFTILWLPSFILKRDQFQFVFLFLPLETHFTFFQPTEVSKVNDFEMKFPFFLHGQWVTHELMNVVLTSSPVLFATTHRKRF